MQTQKEKDKQMSGAGLITQERKRQIEIKRWTAEHDDEHIHGEMALAALAYASPFPVKVQAHVTKPCGCRSAGECTHTFGELQWIDPWPWSRDWDKRVFADGAPAPNKNLQAEKRIDLLVKAGALIAAEIDRLQRLGKKP